MNDIAMLLMALLMVAIMLYVRQLHNKLELLSINPNFKVTTRIAALAQYERHSVKGKAVVTFDIAGMGKANQQHGEVWVNTQVAKALERLRGILRTSDVIAQLNSGDEFFIVVNKGDEVQVEKWVQGVFEIYWPGGVYIASSVVEGDVMEAVTASMEKVYAIKADVKGLKAA